MLHHPGPNITAVSIGPTFYSIFKVSLQPYLHQQAGWPKSLICKAVPIALSQSSLRMHFKGLYFKQILTWCSGLNSCQVTKVRDVHPAAESKNLCTNSNAWCKSKREIREDWFTSRPCNWPKTQMAVSVCMHPYAANSFPGHQHLSSLWEHSPSR